MTVAFASLLRNAGKVFAGGLAVSVIAFLQGVVITRSLGAAGYGRWGLVLSFCALAKALLGFRTSEPLTRFWVQAGPEGGAGMRKLLAQTAIAADFVMSAITVAVVLAGFRLYGEAIGLPGEAFGASAIFSGTILLASLDSTFYSVMRDSRRFSLIAYMPAAVSLSQAAAIGIVAGSGGLDLTSLARIYLAAAAAQFAFSLAFLERVLRREYGIRLFGFDWREFWRGQRSIRGFWAFMRTTYVASCATSVLKNADVLVLGWFAGNSQVGVYRLAKTLASIAQSLGQSLSSVLYQDANEAIRKSRVEDLHASIRHFMKAWAPSVAALVAVSIVVARFAIRPVFGATFAEAWKPFSILMLGVGAAMCLFWVQPVILSSGHHRAYLGSVLGCSALAMVLMPLFAWRFDGNGVALGYSLAWAGAHICMLAALRRGRAPGALQ
jgi:O-antigen/teichoic acid export membrane protein